jgi:hypothetical protein
LPVVGFPEKPKMYQESNNINSCDLTVCTSYTAGKNICSIVGDLMAGAGL